MDDATFHLREITRIVVPSAYDRCDLKGKYSASLSLNLDKSKVYSILSSRVSSGKHNRWMAFKCSFL